MPRRKYPLTDKQRIAVDEYMINGFNIKAALLAAGYTASSAHNSSKTWHQSKELQKYLKKKQAAIAEKHKLTEEWVIQRLMHRADSGRLLANFKQIDEDGQLFWDFTGATDHELALVSAIGVELAKSGRGPGAIDVKRVKVQEADAHAALMALGRHLGIFNDKLEVTGSMAERIKEAKDYARRADEPEDTVETVH